MEVASRHTKDFVLRRYKIVHMANKLNSLQSPANDEGLQI